MNNFDLKQNHPQQKPPSINEILEALNSKNVVGGIFCDLEKAFDSVNHDILC
jgi:hypothetical protein